MPPGWSKPYFSSASLRSCANSGWLTYTNGTTTLSAAAVPSSSFLPTYTARCPFGTAAEFSSRTRFSRAYRPGHGLNRRNLPALAAQRWKALETALTFPTRRRRRIMRRRNRVTRLLRRMPQCRVGSGEDLRMRLDSMIFLERERRRGNEDGDHG